MIVVDDKGFRTPKQKHSNYQLWLKEEMRRTNGLPQPQTPVSNMSTETPVRFPTCRLIQLTPHPQLALHSLRKTQASSEMVDIEEQNQIELTK